MKQDPITERREKGTPHHPEAERILREMARLDMNDAADLKFGGDGDNGETLLLLMSEVFQRDEEKIVVDTAHTPDDKRIDVTIEARFLWMLLHKNQPDFFMLVSHNSEKDPTSRAPERLRPFLRAKYIEITKEPLGIVAEGMEAVLAYGRKRGWDG